jgi:hypothetical protein
LVIDLARLDRAGVVVALGRGLLTGVVRSVPRTAVLAPDDGLTGLNDARPE